MDPFEKASRDDLAHALDRLDFGIVLATPDGTIRFTNEVARRLLAKINPETPPDEPDWSATYDGCLTLRTLVRRATRSSRGKREPRGGSMRVSDADGCFYAIHIGPLAAARASRAATETLTMIVIAPLDASPEPETTALASVFDLTGAQSRLAAALASGVAPNSYARGLGISHNTVRTHLAQLRERVNAKTQAGVVAKILRAVPPVLGWRAGPT